jgi:hypothetical protein
MNRVRYIVASCLLVLIGCSSSPSKDGTSDTSGTSSVPGLPNGPPTTTTKTTSPPAPTDCREAPQLPACREGHEERSSSVP